MSENIKTATERMAPGAPAHDIIPCMLEEIRDLRAALAQAQADYAEAVDSVASLQATLDAQRAPADEAQGAVATVVGCVRDALGNTTLRIGWLRPELCDVGTLLYTHAQPTAEEVTCTIDEIWKAIDGQPGFEGGKAEVLHTLSILAQASDECQEGRCHPALADEAQGAVATVIKRGADRQWMSEALGSLPDGTYSLYLHPAQPAAEEVTGVDNASRMDHIERKHVMGASYGGVTSLNIIVNSDDYATGGARYAIDCQIERDNA